MSEGAGDWVGLKQAALRLGVSERTVRRWLAAGRLEGRRVSTPFGPGWTVRADSAPPPMPQGGVEMRTAGAPPLAELVALVERQQERIVELAARLAVAEAELSHTRTALMAPSSTEPDLETASGDKALRIDATHPWWRRARSWLGA